MIARVWRGAAASSDGAAAYLRHFTLSVAPHLKDIPGHRGAYLLRRDIDGDIEFLAVTLWDSVESILAFTGPNAEVAVVEPEGRAALSRFDEFARNYEIVVNNL